MPAMSSNRPPPARPRGTGFFQNKAFDTFREDKQHSSQQTVFISSQGRGYNSQGAASNTAHTGLSRQLKSRHLQMIAIGGSIGTGLFVGSGQALAIGGPGSLLLAFIWIGVALYCTIQALGEMAVTFPVAGSFSAFSTR